MANINIYTLLDIIAKTSSNDNFPIIMMPDGKEYVIEEYDTNHENNGLGEGHVGIKLVEYKYKKKKRVV